MKTMQKYAKSKRVSPECIPFIVYSTNKQTSVFIIFNRHFFYHLFSIETGLVALNFKQNL